MMPVQYASPMPVNPEALGTVRSLENTSIAGYETFNTILVSLEDTRTCFKVRHFLTVVLISARRHQSKKRTTSGTVCRFLKTVLGWEEIQVRDWQSIQTLITLCAFIGGYFYEIESALTKNLAVQQICHLGGGKGINSRTFFLRGLSTLFFAGSVTTFFRENNISPEQQKQILEFANAYKP